MKIDHLAIWCEDLERMRRFYTTYFDCTSNERYHNPSKRYSSYFLTFDGGNCRIELMHRPDIETAPLRRGFMGGVAHFDLEVGNEAAVDLLVEQLRADGYRIAEEPRRTGDGYYEAVVLDPEGNYVELSAEVVSEVGV